MFDAYKIGVTLSLTNHVSSTLRLIGADFIKTEADAKLLEKRINGIQSTAAKGAGMATLGAGMLALFKVPIDEAKKFDQAVGKFKLFGLSDAANVEAVRFARAMDTMGTSYTDNMKLMTEAQGVFRESGLDGLKALEGSKLAAPMLAKIQFATSSLDDESKEKMHTQSLAMLRFVEMRGGLKDAQSFNRIADIGWKAIQSSGGNVNWEQMRQFMARGGVAAQGLSDTALFGKLEPVIGELKGSTAGNAWMTAYNRLVGGVKVPNQVAHMLAQNGIWDQSKIVWNSQGGIKEFKGNPLKDMTTFGTDPVEFYEKNILPMYAKMNGGKGVSAEERARDNTLIFGRTGGMMFSLVDRQLATIHRSVDAQNRALGVDASVQVAGKTMEGKEVDLDAKWAKAMTDLGNVVLPHAIVIVEKLTNALVALDSWMLRNQDLVKQLTWAFAALGAGLMIRGSVLLLTAALRGLGLALIFEKAGGLAGLSKVGTVINSLGAELGIVGKLGFIAAAAFAGWKLGKWLYDTVLAGTKFADWLGSLIAKFLSWIGIKDAEDARNGMGKSVIVQDPAVMAKQLLQTVESARGTEREKYARNMLDKFYALHPEMPRDVVPPPAAATQKKESAAESINSVLGGYGSAGTADFHAALSQSVADGVKNGLNGAAVHMDGEPVGRLVMNQMDRGALSPSTGVSSFDSRLGPMRPDYPG